MAAEQYFESIHHMLPEFQGRAVENTTRLGCGYDFRLQTEASDDFQESPFHEIFQNPLFSGLQFRRNERRVVQVSWLANV